MKNRSFRTIAPLACLLLGIAFFSTRSLLTRFADRSQPGLAHHHDESRGSSDSHNNTRSSGRSKADDAASAALFPDMEVGTPTPLKPYPRGENQRRRYQAPTSRDAADLPSNAPRPWLAMRPEDGRMELNEDELLPHTLEAVRLVFNPEAVEQVINNQARTLMLPTPDGGSLQFDVQSIKTRSSRTHTLIGKLAGEEPDSDVMFVYHDGGILGHVTRYPKAEFLQYRMLPDGYMMARELDASTMTANCVKPPAAEQAKLDQAVSNTGCSECTDCGGKPAAASELLESELENTGVDIDIQVSPDGGDALPETPGYTTVDVVVGYGQQARTRAGGVSAIEADIIAAVDRMTQAFENSQITNTEMMLLGTIEDPYYVFGGSVPNNIEDELNELNELNDGSLDTVTDYATELGADFHSFIIKEPEGGAAGVAFLGDDTSITAWDYITPVRLTFAHELGHNFGCDHSWGDSSAAYHDRYGWRFDLDGNASTTNDRYRTIMAYDWNWGQGVRVPYYANPNVKYPNSNAPTGAPLGYNVTGDGYADQRYKQGGLSGFNATGFDGTKPNLGARNYLAILSGTNPYGGAPEASGYATRTEAELTLPAEGLQYQPGQFLSVNFLGGDHTYTPTIELFKGDVLIETLASGGNAATDRSMSWLIPGTTEDGNDYLVRVTLSHDTNPDIVMESGFFTIGEADPRILSHTPSPTPSPINAAEITFNFSEVMDTSSFSVADDIRSFTGPRGIDLSASINGHYWSENDTRLTITFSGQDGAGFYRMVIGPFITDLKGNNLDQDLDEVDGELIDDTYMAIVGLDGSGPGVVWSDMVGNDAPDAGWRFPVGGSWQKGNPSETPPDGPDSGVDGGQIISTNLSGSYWVDEQSFAESPYLDLSGESGVSLRFRMWYGVEVNDMLWIDCWSGSAWVRIFELTGTDFTGKTGGWVTYSRDVSAYADGNPQFRIRWGVRDISIGRDHEEGTGWQIDAVELLGTTPTEPIPAPVIVNDFTLGESTDPKSSLYFEFSSPMNDTTFGLEDIVSFGGPAGSISPSGSEWISSSMLRIDFPEQSADGTYTMVMGPTIQDTEGKLIDQDLDGIEGEATEDEYTATFIIGDGSAPYTLWTQGTFTYPFTSSTPTGNQDGDDWLNYVEFAFGTDPTVPSWGPIQYVEGGDVTSPGSPIAVNAGTMESPVMRAVFGRRKDYLAAGLTYTVWFSADLSEWASVTDVPTLLTSDPSAGDIEAVYVPYPATINPGSGDVVPLFFRVQVNMN